MAGPARADGGAGAPTTGGGASAEVASTADLDGLYLALGPAAGAVRVDGTWDGGFGGAVALYRFRERSAASVVGIAGGAFGFSEREGGHVWGEAVIGTGAVLGVQLGAGAGVTAEVDPVAPPLWGAHGTLWAAAGVIPYVRAGYVDRTGMFVDFGFRVALPAVRW